MKCPTCNDSFDTERAMKIHHKLSHDESIALESANCGNCGKEFTYYPSSKQGIYCSSCIDNKSVSWTAGQLFGKDNPNWDNNYGFKSGEDNINWRGGVDTRYGASWDRWRRRILNRDNRECQSCGSDKDLHIHHIIPRRDFEVIEDSHYYSNLITLCSSCHKRVEHGSMKCPEPKDLSI